MTARVPRVAVTRDEPENGPLATALRSCGLDPVACAVVREAGAPDPARLVEIARALGTYDWLVVTSRRAVTALQEARSHAPWPRSLRTAAVGEATAAALIECGADDPICADGSGVMVLIDTMRAAESWSGKRVLLPRAQEGRLELGEALRASGARVDEVIAYRTVAVRPAEVANRWRHAAPDAAVVASPSAARALVAGVGAETLRRLQLIAAIGSTTQAVLEGLGVPAHTPPSANFPAVAALVAERLEVTAIPAGGVSHSSGNRRAFRKERGIS